MCVYVGLPTLISLWEQGGRDIINMCFRIGFMLSEDITPLSLPHGMRLCHAE